MDNRIPKKFYTTEEVADLLRLHVQTVRNMVLQNRIGGVKIGTEWRVSCDDLSEFLQGNHNK